MQVLIDGRSQYLSLFRSGVNWNLRPVVLENIDRIEVIRGSNTVSYGSNAFLGVVNVITLDASQTRGWMVSANHGNASIRDETIRWGSKAGPADVRMTYRQLGDDGFRKMYDGNLGWFDPHDSRHSKAFDLRLDAPLSDRDELQVSLSHSEEVSQYGGPQSLGDPFHDLNQSSTSLSAEWRRILGGRRGTETAVFACRGLGLKCLSGGDFLQDCHGQDRRLLLPEQSWWRVEERRVGVPAYFPAQEIGPPGLGAGAT